LPEGTAEMPHGIDIFRAFRKRDRQLTHLAASNPRKSYHGGIGPAIWSAL
jgi:hypothetical protein